MVVDFEDLINSRGEVVSIGDQVLAGEVAELLFLRCFCIRIYLSYILGINLFSVVVCLASIVDGSASLGCFFERLQPLL